MPIQVTLGEGDRVTASVKGRAIDTDQDGSAPAPFDLFLASIATCTGYYVSSFCRKRGIPLDGIELEQRSVRDPETGRIERVEIELRLPDEFPDRYREAVLRAAAQCTVKKYLESPPEVRVNAIFATPAG